MKPFPLILITSPEDFADEHVLLEAMFQRGLSRLHVRKPRKDSRAMEKWILELEPTIRPQLVVHGHSDLVCAFGLSGSHGDGGTSNSFHSFGELENCESVYNYGFLSPIFDSYSKPGYSSAFDSAEISEGLSRLKELPNRKVQEIYALGGLDEDRIPQVWNWGFDGAAVLGAIWNAADPLEAWDRIYQASCLAAGMDAILFPPIESWTDALKIHRSGDISW